METCPSCGARLAPDLAWCGQCLRALPRESTSPAAVARRLPQPERHEAIYSRWKGGPTSFGPVGRILMTLGVVAGLAIGEPMFRGLVLSSVGFDIPASGALGLYLAAAIPAGIFLLTRVWKRARVA